MTPANYLADV